MIKKLKREATEWEKILQNICVKGTVFLEINKMDIPMDEI